MSGPNSKWTNVTGTLRLCRGIASLTERHRSRARLGCGLTLQMRHEGERATGAGVHDKMDHAPSSK